MPVHHTDSSPTMLVSLRVREGETCLAGSGRVKNAPQCEDGRNMPSRVREGETCPSGLMRGEHAPQGKEEGNMLWGVGWVRFG